MTGWSWRTAALLLVLSLPANTPAAGQAAATIPPQDPVYRSLARLDAFGLLAGRSYSQGPVSGARVNRMIREASLALPFRTDLSEGVRNGLESLILRLEERNRRLASSRISVFTEVEAGGGRSEARSIPESDIGALDVAVNPLWSGFGGRAHGDRVNGAMAARLGVPVTEYAALVLGVRQSQGEYTGIRPWRTGTALEAIYARGVIGRFAMQVGRDHLQGSGSGVATLLLGRDAPPVDLLRVSSDRPMRIRGIGALDFELFAADLGPHQHFPHEKLFGIVLRAQPGRRLQLGLTLLNKQLGEGAPDATTEARLKDLTWVWDWFRPGVYDFSDKTVGLNATLRTGPLVLSGETVLTDFDHRRLSHTFVESAGYRLGIGAPALGPGGRHSIHLVATTTGPVVYRHHQFRSGLAVDRFSLGSELGPDALGLEVRYAVSDLVSGWSAEWAMALDERSGDGWSPATSDSGEGLLKVHDLPEEQRVRMTVRLDGSLPDALLPASASGVGGVEVRFGVERVRQFRFGDGDDRTGIAGLLRVWWTP